MRKSLLLFLTLHVLFGPVQAQTIMGRQIVDQYPKNSSGTLTYGLTWLPQSYSNTSRSYPLIISLHGAGETGTTVSTLSKLYTASPRSISGRIADGWNAVSMNPRTNQTDSFIVVSPQAPTWSYGYAELKYILPDIISRYRVDTSRIYLAGLSAGGGGAFTTLGSMDTTFLKKFAAVATASSAGVSAANGYTATEVEANLRYASKNYGVKVWTVAGEQDYLLTTDVRYHDSTNKLNPNPANKLTVIFGVGHSAWGRAFDTLFRPVVNYYGNTGTCNNGCNNGGIAVAPNANGSPVRGSGVTQDSLNVYEWFLLWQRSFPAVTTPSANAGADINITIPTTSVTLNGSGTPGQGFTISSYSWSKIAGPSSFSITNPSNPSTTVTGLVPGTYTFRLTVTNNSGASAADNVIVTVTDPVYASPVITSISANQVITLPVNLATLTGTYSFTGSTLGTLKWKKFKSPGQTKRKLGVIGSSTSQGNGASSGDSSYVGLLRSFLVSNGIVDTVVNLGMSGYSVFRGMPTGYTPSGNQEAPDPARNVTAILNRNVDAVIVNYPSNGFDILSVGEIMMAYQTIYDTCLARGVECFITTTQPREDWGPTHQQFLKTLRDSILNRFGTHAINFYDPISIPGTTSVINEYEYGDLIHLNNKGHRQLFNKVVAAGIFEQAAGSSSIIQTPLTATTIVSGLTPGTHVFQLSVTDSREQSANSLATVVVNGSGSTNQVPVANAGPDRTITLPVSNTTLNGSGTDSDGSISGYGWTKLTGPASFSIANPTSATTAVSGLVQGTYLFELTVTDNGGATDKDTVQVVVNAAPSTTCTGTSYTPLPGGDNGYYNRIQLNPGDTLFIDATRNWSYIYLENQHGTPQCPIVIMNKGGQAVLTGNQMKLRSCSYIKVLGTGAPGVQYGFLIRPYPEGTLTNGMFAFVINGRSKNIEVSNVSVRNCGVGFEVKEDGGCDPQFNFPNWVIDSISLHDNSVVHAWNEGMYIGNTSPDNAPDSYSPRPVVCNGVVTYPRPIRVGNIKIYNNYVDSTGRSGIQVASASGGMSEIYNNVVRHAGMNGDDAQGVGIALGTYTRAYVHDNTISNTYTWGIGSLGASATNIPLRIENNVIDSSGYLQHYNLVFATYYTINTLTAPTYPNTLTWPQSMYLSTKPTYYTDSTRFWVKNNILGRRKSTNGIAIADYRNTFHKSGNIVCNNVNMQGGALAPIVIEEVIPVYYSTDCSGTANAAPFANAGANQTITLPTNSIALTGTGIDTDGTISSTLWTKISGPSSFTIAAPNNTSSNVTGLVQGVYLFEFRVTDNGGLIGRDTVQITVNASAPPNQAPTANAGSDRTITLPTNSTTLNGSGTDTDGTISGYSWTKIAGPASFTIASPTSAATNITGLVQGVYRFELRVTDNGGLMDRDTVQVTVNAAPVANQAPTANAGPDRNITLPTNSTTLNGSGTDSDGTISGYNWTKISGPASFTIATPTTATTNITGLVQGVYLFELRVTDNGGLMDRDTVQVTVNAAPVANQAPTANAGPDRNITLPTNSTTLNGSGTDSDGTISGYNWTKISGPASFTIATPTTATTNITGLVQGVYLFELRVTDNGGLMDRDTVQVTVNAAPVANQAPTANAGPDRNITLPTNSTTLNGSGTDSDGTISGYSWTKISGPTSFTISSPTTATTNITALVQGVYLFEFRVTDNGGLMDRDTVRVTVNPAIPVNQTPSANAGPDITITLPTNSALLAGSGMDTDGNIVGYEWKKVGGSATYNLLTPDQASTEIRNLDQGVYTFTLTVTDNQGATGTDSVVVTVLGNTNTRPGFLDFKVFPNPIQSGMLNITMGFDSTGEKYEIRIASLKGETLYRSGKLETIAGGTVLTYPVDRLRPGMYYVELVFQNGRKLFRKFIKQ